MVRKSKPIGNKLISKAREKYHTPMATIFKANIACPKSTVKECTFGVLITQSMRVSSERMLWKVRLGFTSLSNNTIPVV